MTGQCLPSQRLRQKIVKGEIKVENISLAKDEKGWFSNTDLESRIQPASFEPTIGDELYILDTELLGGFRPGNNETVRRSLLRLPQRQRLKVQIDSSGFELKTGFTYLFPLEERISLKEGERVESSPKSSTGRVFLRTRMLADCNPTYEEIHYSEGCSNFLQPWLLVQPLTFNTIIRPGDSLNQLRFFEGDNAMLTSSEIRMEMEKHPIVRKKGENEKVKPNITDGIQIHADFTGENMEGIVGLRARRNPLPIDLRKIGVYDAENYFEPIVIRDGKVEIKRGEHYLLTSAEVLSIPPHLSVQLKRHSIIGLSGPVDFAGFIDNGFEGDLVFELRSDEPRNITAEAGLLPVSKLEIFRSEVPDKIYGKSIGSSYQQQTGIRPAKGFRKFDYGLAARNYAKLNRDVLVMDAKDILKHHQTKEPFSWISEAEGKNLLNCIKEGFFHSRYDCESDEMILQPIPYVLILGEGGKIFSYVRSKEIKDYGDTRLFGKHSIGLGGHIQRKDAPDYIERCLSREIGEEVNIHGKSSPPKLIGTLMAYDKPVDRVHFGLVYVIPLAKRGYVAPKEASIITGRMISLDEIEKDRQAHEKYETWSNKLLPLLPEIYSRTFK